MLQGRHAEMKNRRVGARKAHAFGYSLDIPSQAARALSLGSRAGLRPIHLAGLSRLVPAVGDIQCRHNDEQNKDEGKRDHDIAPLEKPKRWLSVERERMKRAAERLAPNFSSRRRAL